MRTSIHLLSGACCLFLIIGGPVGADDSGGASPVVGQVRTLAVDPADHAEMLALAHQGWIEASGQVLSTHSYHSLYHAIGRTWTPSHVASTEFALPDLDRAATPTVSTRNPFGVLDPGDMVSGGKRESAARPSLRHFIYVGRDASELTSTH
jgi:microcystin-dependent protein